MKINKLFEKEKLWIIITLSTFFVVVGGMYIALFITGVCQEYMPGYLLVFVAILLLPVLLSRYYQLQN